MNATRSAPAWWNANWSAAGCRCVPSLISSTVIRSSSRSAVIGPGERWPRGGIALKRWVATVAPASMASTVCSYVASVWPIAAITPCSARRRTESRPPGSSVASVTILAWPRAASISLRTSAGCGSRRRFSAWAPLRQGEMNGPSKWTPAISPCSASSLSRPARWVRKSRSPVTVEATRVVVPCRRWVWMPLRMSSAEPEVKEAPPPPWLWRSTKPGMT